MNLEEENDLLLQEIELQKQDIKELKWKIDDVTKYHNQTMKIMKQEILELKIELAEAKYSNLQREDYEDVETEKYKLLQTLNDIKDAIESRHLNDKEKIEDRGNLYIVYIM